MAQEDESETSQQTAASEDEKGAENQASPTIIEIQDSTTECEEEARPGLLQMEEKVFVSSLHSFMKDRGTPIERIPHLGFKQINLWRIFKAVEKLGGYDSVTVRRLWKKVYDELGGSPGSTSAATCTRRHYEKLVLPFERHVKGEDDKPLPPSKPRKPYKRNLDGKIHKAEKKRSKSDRELDAEILTQRSPEAACHAEAVMRPHPLWPAASDRHHPEPGRVATGLHNSVYARLVQVPTSSHWTHIPAAAAAGQVISPLEKKKRVAQASLHLPQSPQSEDKERPSVIQCSQSPAQASSSQNCNSSEGSPVPLSSSSSRSPSPSSVSSDDGAVVTESLPVSATELERHCSTSEGETSGRREESRSGSCGQTSKDTAGHSKDLAPISYKPVDSLKVQVIDPAWKQSPKGSGRYYTFHPSSPFAVKSDLVPTPTSSFTKVIPKSVPVLRPTPTLPSYKTPQGGLLQQEDSVTRAKKLNVAPWFYQMDKREKTRTMLQKVPSAQQSMCHSTANLPALRTLSGYDKAGRDSRHPSPLHPVFFPNRMRLPQSQLLYHHVPVSPAHSALIGPAVYPYPYSIPLLNPQAGYAIPAMNTIYPHKL